MICDQAHDTEKNACDKVFCLQMPDFRRGWSSLSRPFFPGQGRNWGISDLAEIFTCTCPDLFPRRNVDIQPLFSIFSGRLTCSSGAAQEVNPNFVVVALVRTPDAKRIVRDFESTMHANVALSLGTRRFYEPTNICPLDWYTTWRAPEVVNFERLKRQHRLEPPPESLLPLPFSSLLHHLSSVYIAIDVNIFYTRIHVHVHVNMGVTFVVIFLEETQSGTRTFLDVCCSTSCGLPQWFHYFCFS